MDASESQAIKRYNLFDLTSYSEGKGRRPEAFNITAEEIETKYRLSSLVSLQGIVGFSDIWYILGIATSSAKNTSPQHTLMVYSKGNVLTVLRAHRANYGIWGVDTKEVKLVVTLGEDLILDPNAGRENTQEEILSPVIKIWDPECLMDGKYESIDRESDGMLRPREILLNQPVSLRSIMALAVSNTLSTIAVGLDNGSVLVVSSGSKKALSLYECEEKDYVYFCLDPEPGFTSPVTNLFISNFSEGKKIGYAFCASEKGFYCQVFGPKARKLIPINKEIVVLPNGMDCIEDNIVILATNTFELLKYKGLDLVSTFKLNEMGVGLALTLENSAGRKGDTVHSFGGEVKAGESVRHREQAHNLPGNGGRCARLRCERRHHLPHSEGRCRESGANPEAEKQQRQAPALPQKKTL